MGESVWRVRFMELQFCPTLHMGPRRPVAPFPVFPSWHLFLLCTTALGKAPALWGTMEHRSQAQGYEPKGRLWQGPPGNGLTEDNVRHSACAFAVIKSSVNSDMRSQEGTSPIHYPEHSCTLGGDSSAILHKVSILYFIQAEKYRKL